MYNDLVRASLKEKNIILFEPGEHIIEFCRKYGEKIHIGCCVTCFSENVMIQPLKEVGIVTKIIDEVSFSDEDFVIICDINHFCTAEQRLVELGLKPYENYIGIRYAIPILENKRILVTMGNACMEQLINALMLEPDVCEEYYCYYFNEKRLTFYYRNFYHRSIMAEYVHMVHVCDVYIASVCDKRFYERKIKYKDELKEGCQAIYISDFTFGGYFPQVVPDRNILSRYLLTERKDYDSAYDTNVMAREDICIKNLIGEGLSIQKIVDTVSDVNFLDEAKILEHFDSAIERMKKSDADSTIKLADYLSDFGKKQVAYLNLDEWSPATLRYVMGKVLDYLNIKDESIDNELLGKVIMEKMGSEIPIYPSVINTFKFASYDEKKYKIRTYYKTRYLNFQEYIGYITQAMKKTDEFNSFLGICEKN